MKNQNAPRSSEHPPVRGEKMSKPLLTRFFSHKERYEMFDGKIFARKSCQKN